MGKKSFHEVMMIAAQRLYDNCGAPWERTRTEYGAKVQYGPLFGGLKDYCWDSFQERVSFGKRMTSMANLSEFEKPDFLDPIVLLQEEISQIPDHDYVRYAVTFNKPVKLSIAFQKEAARALAISAFNYGYASKKPIKVEAFSYCVNPQNHTHWAIQRCVLYACGYPTFKTYTEDEWRDKQEQEGRDK